MVKDGIVTYLTENQKDKQYFNIPIANTTVLLLGTGTSITQSAVRMLVSAAVIIGFSGGGGTPLLASNEVEWICPQSEYRPTEYMQSFLSFWYDEEIRLRKAKILQNKRIEFIKDVWRRNKELKKYGFYIDDNDIKAILNKTKNEIDSAQNLQKLLSTEGLFVKEIYRILSKRFNIENFKRENDNPKDKTNRFLNHGNYLAYGLAATTLWVLGLPHGFALMHGKTRRGGLVFDVADLVKDAIVLPYAFISSSENQKEQQFRDGCIQLLHENKALDFMFEAVQEISLMNNKK
jgi:CRISPR-associated protein Cas1